MDRLFKEIEQSKNFGDFLVDYTYPSVSYEEEIITWPLRDKEIAIDGYDIKYSYNKAKYDAHYLETLQLMSKDFPNLPFNVVCTFAKNFLGEKFLSFIDLEKEGKKVYIWTCKKDFNNKKIPPNEEETQEANYEGFQYHILNPEAVNFF